MNPRVPLSGRRHEPVTAAAVERAFLEPGMEARARNLQQFDPSPETDSLLEQMRALVLSLPPCDKREGLLDLLGEAIASNGHEGEAERSINRHADLLVADLRHIERNGTGAALTSKSIARAAQPALSCLTHLSVASAGEISESHRVLRELVEAVPRLSLLSKTVERELGAKKFAALRQFAQKSGAARSAAAGAVARSEGSRHAQH